MTYDADGHQVDDVFRIWATSPAWFEQELEKNRAPIPGRHRLVTDRWSHGDIIAALDRLVAGCEADDWRQLRAQLRTVGAPADGY